MAVISRDIFSGDADADIDGRVPDGGLTPELGVGAWDYVTLIGTNSACCITVVPGVGAQATLGNNQKHSHYRLTGITAPDDLTVRATVDFRAAGANAWVDILLNHQGNPTGGVPSLICYAVELSQAGIALYEVFNTVGAPFTLYSLVSGVGFTSALASGPHTFEVDRIGNTIFASVDGVAYLVAILDPAIYTIITGGLPGLSIANATALEREVTVTLYEVDVPVDGDDPSSPDFPTPCGGTVQQAVYSRDTYTGPDSATIDGRIPDGGGAECLQQGVWNAVPMRLNTSPLQHVEIKDQQAIQITSADPWNHTEMVGIPNLGNDYTVEVQGYFTHSGFTNPYAWFSCLARQQLGVQSRTFTSSTTWVAPDNVTSVKVRCWQGGAGGGGATGTISAGGGGAGGTYAEKTVAVTPGLTYTITIGAARTATAGAGAAGNPTMFQLAGVDLVRADGAQGGGLASGGSSNGAGGAANTAGSIGDLIQAGTAGSAGNFTAGVAGGQGGAGAEGGGAGGAAPGDNNVGLAGAAPGGGGSGGKTQSATDRAGGASGRGQMVIEYGSSSRAGESGWELLWDTEGHMILEYYEVGIYTHVVTVDLTPPTIGQTYRVRMCLVGSKFCCYLDDELIILYEDTRWPTGTPGWCMHDNAGDGSTAKVTQWKVVANESGAPLCAPGGGSHIPGGGGGEEVPALIWGVKQGAWRPAPTPSEADTVRVQGHRHGAKRQAKKAWEYVNGAWRLAVPVGTGGFIDDGSDYNGDPGDTIDDPGCGTAQPDIPPSVPLDPIGERVFACYNLPGDTASSPFDTAIRPAAGGFSGLLSAAAAEGTRVIATVGGYAKFSPGGSYSYATYANFVADVDASWGSAINDAIASGVLVGVIVSDDVRNPNLTGTVSGWPPNGLSNAEIEAQCAVWKSHFPLIRTMVREEPEVLNEGAGSIPSLDCPIAQYAARFGTIEDWVADQLSQKAAGGFSEIMFGINVYKGGDGRSGDITGTGGFGRTLYSMTPGEYIEKGSVLARQMDSIGIEHWKYVPYLWARAGMIDAFATVRNILAGVGG